MIGVKLRLTCCRCVLFARHHHVSRVQPQSLSLCADHQTSRHLHGEEAAEASSSHREDHGRRAAAVPEKGHSREAETFPLSVHDMLL